MLHHESKNFVSFSFRDVQFSRFETFTIGYNDSPLSLILCLKSTDVPALFCLRLTFKGGFINPVPRLDEY
jgi:hypothetical protein